MKNRLMIGVVLLAGMAQATEYNLTTSFSTNTNPNGVWSYGAMDVGFTNFTVSPWYPAWGAWRAVDNDANIWINNSESTEYGIPPGSVSLHPGSVSPGAPATIRWTAPMDIGSATIQISGAYGSGDLNSPTVSVRQGTNSLWSALNAGSFNETVSVVPGDTIDFCVYGETSYANTPLSATITVLSAKPYISEQPASVYTDAGDLVLFSVAATASSGTLSYAWTKDSVPLADNEYVAGSTYGRLAISPARLSDAGSYQVVVSDDLGSVTSSVATLVLDLPLPSITAEPADTTVASGANASFSVAASNAASYQWYRGDSPVSDGGSISGATTATLQISAADQTNNAVYCAHIANARGTIISRAARLTVTATSSLGTALDNSAVQLGNPGGWNAQTAYTQDGVDAMRSAPISHNQSTEMNATLFGPGEMNFQWFVSSENSDPLRYYFDTVLQASISGTSGGWAALSRFIPENEHEISWIYSKDISINTGLDAGFVDQLVFTPYLLSSVSKAVEGLPGPLVFGGAGNWYGQAATSHDGTDAARAPAIGNNESAWFETTVTGPGRVVFWAKTSCESSDRLRLRVDGTEVYQLGGIQDWQAVTNWIDWGEHTLRFSYEKDFSNAYEDDTVWIDQVNYTAVGRSSIADALDSSSLVWTTSSNAPWFGQDRFSSDGIDALQSGVIGNDGESWVKTTIDGPGTLSFRWKSSSESPDYIRFLTNGTQIAYQSGLTDWSTNSFAIPEGQNIELMWKYTKDYSATAGEDAVWLDQVVFEPQLDPVVLTVAPSPHGSPAPAPGTYTNDYGTTVSFSVADVTSGSTQYECIGWTGTGSVPASGTTNALSATLNEDSSIAWNWQTNYWLEVSVSGNGSVDHPSGWYAKGSGQILAATPDAGWLFMGWSGAASGTNEAFVTMSDPKTIMATFSDDADGDGLTNAEEATIGSDPWNPDTDGDGFGDKLEVDHNWNPIVSDQWAVDYIGANGDDFGLYASNVVLDVAVGQILLETAGGNAALSLQLEQSDDLNTWTNAGNAVEWLLPVDASKQYFRVRSSGQ